MTVRNQILQILGWLVAGSALAGPFGNETSGLAATSLVAKGWIVDAVWTAPLDGSGGYARNESGTTSFVGAVRGAPAAFGLNDTTRHVASLGNGGSVVLSFSVVMHNGPGPDFAVFENGFTDYTDFTGTSRETNTNSFAFVELAFVDGASTTSSWARFPPTCLATEPVYAPHGSGAGEEGRFFSMDVSLVDGFAGRHIITHGTPFDLSLLTNHPAVLSGAVDLSAIRFIRLTDVVGDGSTVDAEGRPVLDPFYDPTDGYPAQAPVAATDGFDLRGVAILQTLDAHVGIGAGGPTVSWYADSGACYRVEAMRPASGTSWQPVGGVVTGAAAVVSVTDSSPDDSRLYRVVSWGAR